MFLSLLFELMELTFKHILLNFFECWWDAWILDFFGMNLLGIIAGYYTVNFFQMKKYKWLKTQPSNSNKYLDSLAINEDSTLEIESTTKKQLKTNLTEKGIFKYLTPNEVEVFDWDIFSSTWRFTSVLWFCATVMLTDLSHFFLKTILHLPNTHWILAFRIFMWGFLCIMATREYYEYITNLNCKKLGQFIWISQCILFVEWLIIFKFEGGMFKNNFPIEVKYSWTAALIIVSVILIRLLTKDIIKLIQNKKESVKETERNVITIEY